VYRVDAGGRAYVLKVAAESDPADRWRRKLAILRDASTAGLAPRVIHADETRRAVTSELVVDRGFPPWFGDPSTRDAALDALGRTLRRVHELPLAPDPDARPPRDFLAQIWSGMTALRFPVPASVARAVERGIAEEPPPRDRDPVLSHNDVNPTNLIYDGERVVLLDWDMAGENDPLYDLAAIAVFLRMDDATAARLVAIHDGAPIAALSPRFTYMRRLVATLCGLVFLHIARHAGHAGSTDETALPLGDFYVQLRTGAVQIASPAGQWAFGLSLIDAAISRGPRV
jgi:aminoglycoside phosphotransferase (APT) family kinase protein